MPDIVTSKTFVYAEKEITASKLNQIISGAVIQPSFVSSKPASPTLDPTDQMLELKGAGTYATITGQQLIDSVSASVTQNITPTIWSVRLRSFNAISNPTFECDQRNVGNSVVIGGSSFFIDRWRGGGVGTWGGSAQQQGAVGSELVVPGTNFQISRSFLRITLATAQASLGANDYMAVWSLLEGPRFRELQFDVHSISLLVRSSVSGLKFGVGLRDSGSTRSLTKLCTIPSANTWTLITLPNIPIWAAGGSWTAAPGSLGYQLTVSLAGGSTVTAPANDTWQNGNFNSALGQDNFASKPVSSTFDIAFVQHEPGNQCSTLIDCPFEDNLLACQRYYSKSSDYGTLPASGPTKLIGNVIYSAAIARCGVYFPKRMAKSPTMRFWGNAGAANTVYVETMGANQTVTGSNVDSTGITSVSWTTAAGASGPPSVIGMWDADTGW